MEDMEDLATEEIEILPQIKLPVPYQDLLKRADKPLEFSSERELYSPVTIDNWTKKFWLDQATRKLCFIMSTRILGAVHGLVEEYWCWIPQEDSSFREVYRLKSICWFAVGGQFDAKFLPRGIPYTVSFKLKLEKPFGWRPEPVKFEITTPYGHQQVSARYLHNTKQSVYDKGFQKACFRHVENGWIEFDAGEFVVEENDNSPKEVKFCMREYDGGNWKGGLLIDCVKIQPSFLVNKKDSNSGWNLCTNPIVEGLNVGDLATGEIENLPESKLPSQYQELLKQADKPLEFWSERELYFLLYSPVTIDNGTKKFWLDQATRKICFMLSTRILNARNLNGVNEHVEKYWCWIPRDDSSFREVARLDRVCWLDVGGQFDVKFLPRGIAYTVSFKLKLDEPSGERPEPVKFEITTPSGHQQLSALYLQNTRESVYDKGFQKASFRHVDNGWMEFDAGEFVVKENDKSPKEVMFRMREHDGNWIGLLIDCVKIQPSFLVNKTR